MSFGSVKLTQNDGTMHHLGIDESKIARSVILVPDPLQVPAYAARMDQAEKVGEYREYVTFTGTIGGAPLSVMSCGFGCMPMAIAVEELNHLGVRQIIKIDCCPAIDETLLPGTLCIASSAVRGEGATAEYVDVSYPAVADMQLLGKLLRLTGRSAHPGIFRSHDCSNFETPWTPDGCAAIRRWSALGVSILDGETSALFVLSSILNLKSASIAVVSENYITGAKQSDLEQAKTAAFALAAEALLCS